MRIRVLASLAALALTVGLSQAPASASPNPAASSSEDRLGGVLSSFAGESVGGFENYVALGDSYTAGPLIPTQLPGPLGCFRSSANYPAFLAAYLRVKTFTDVSCSSARTEHLFTSQTGNLPDGSPENLNAPQLLAVTDETDLVTLGIGGNDFGLFGQMIDQCADLAAEHPEAHAPCKNHFTVRGVDTKLRDAKRIQTNIEHALRAIKNRAPQATVVVVNYLHILPETGTCSNIPFAAGDYAWGTKVHRQLNQSLRNAARKFGATYVDMYAASAGHDACAGIRDIWVNGSTILPNAMNFHPFRAGMRAIADTTYWELTGSPAPQALPTLQAIKRLPAIVDVQGLLEYAQAGGPIPPEVLEEAREHGDAPPATPGLPETPSLAESAAPAIEQIRSALTQLEEVFAAIDEAFGAGPAAILTRRAG